MAIASRPAAGGLQRESREHDRDGARVCLGRPPTDRPTCVAWFRRRVLSPASDDKNR